MSGMTKAERLEDMKRLYIQRAFSDIEMAERLGVDRTLIYRDRIELTGQYPIEKDDEGRYHIPRTKLISEIKVNLHEALTLYLAARKTSRQTRFHHPHAANALEKLAATLRQPMTEKLLKAADAVLKQEKDPERIKIIETLAQAWVEQKKVRIEYQPFGMDGLTRHTISPYLIEPSIWSDSVYVIALSDFNDKIVPFKIERIKTAILSGETFEIPVDFDDQQLLKHAWGIWYGDKDPVTVKLRFSKTVTRRVKESIWHPLEKVEDTEDGGCIWSVDIAEWREMLPWIRGWGADCEVLEPKTLREALEKEVKKMARVYGVGQVELEDDLIAHRRKNGEEQLLRTHLIEASQLAEGFVAKVGLPEIGKVLGLLHDFGKASQEYQNYLRTQEGLINPDEDNYSTAKRGEVDHSTAGAQLIYEKFAHHGQEGKILAQFLSLAIASHHSGLIDCLKPNGNNKFEERITKVDEKTHLTEARSKLHDIEKQLDEILAQPIEKRFYQAVFEAMTEASDSKDTRWFKRGLLARFLLSCLLEADRLNTADFENPGNEDIRNYGKYIPWNTLIERLEAKYTGYARETAQMKPGQALEVNQLRAQVAQACLEAAEKPKGIYQLTVPTGGGKTEASLRFALHHARANKMDRIFYIVPYITIIDQNADKVRKILEKADERGKVILEHHSNFVPSDDTRRRHNLLAENWDAPIVFTTQVQFLEALFGYGTRDARRMHQLANSVIIFDEVQTVPIRITHMFTTALRFLTHDCGSTVVLCTATQPPFDKTGNPYRELSIPKENHIIQNEPGLFKRLKRVEVHDERKPGGLTNVEIANLAEQALQEKGSVLIVVNTRPSALALHKEIKDRNLGVKTYHLSTNMCPAHRMDVLENKIKPKLKAKEPVICVSTQLIEAGVDIDFGAVIRALAGLDSIAQSAGRCNRHGMREDGGSVWVVNPQEENLDRLKDIKVGREHAQTVLDDFRIAPDSFGNDQIGLDAIATYYNQYYHSQKDKMDYPVGKNSSVERDDNLFSLLSLNELSTNAFQASHHSAPDILLRQSFRTANGEFRVIDSLTRGVIVPYKDGYRIITELCGAFGLEKQGKLLKQAQRYSVNLFTYQFDQLFKAGAIKEVQPEAGIYHLNEQYYTEEFGWSDEPVSDMTVHIE
ncbi:MAG: CRISPR-associated helicase Cas3' [Chloroflexi bacterium]|nr:CRISPR-associated helicase Cas3' [Chloroflexota bacterium]